MPEANALLRILAYMAESRINAALEAEDVANMAPEAIMAGELWEPSKTTTSEIQRFDCIYEEEPLGFEKDPRDNVLKMQTQYPLEEVDLSDG